MMYEHLQASPPGLAVLRQLAEGGCTSIEATEYFVRFTKGLSFSDVASLKGDKTDDAEAQGKVLAYLYAGG